MAGHQDSPPWKILQQQQQKLDPLPWKLRSKSDRRSLHLLLGPRLYLTSQQSKSDDGKIDCILVGRSCKELGLIFFFFFLIYHSVLPKESEKFWIPWQLPMCARNARFWADTRGWQTTGCGPNGVSCLFLQIKFYWDTFILFMAAFMLQQQSLKVATETGWLQSLNIYYLVFYRKMSWPLLKTLMQ